MFHLLLPSVMLGSLPFGFAPSKYFNGVFGITYLKGGLSTGLSIIFAVRLLVLSTSIILWANLWLLPASCKIIQFHLQLAESYHSGLPSHTITCPTVLMYYFIYSHSIYHGLPKQSLILNNTITPTWSSLGSSFIPWEWVLLRIGHVKLSVVQV